MDPLNHSTACTSRHYGPDPGCWDLHAFRLWRMQVQLRMTRVLQPRSQGQRELLAKSSSSSVNLPAGCATCSRRCWRCRVH